MLWGRSDFPPISLMLACQPACMPACYQGRGTAPDFPFTDKK